MAACRLLDVREVVGLDIVGGVSDILGGVSEILLVGRLNDTLGEVTADEVPDVEGASTVVVAVVGGTFIRFGAKGFREAAVLESMGSHIKE